MNEQEQKQMIVETVTSVQGCKATELAARKEIALGCEDLPKLIDELVEAGRLMELEYVLPGLRYRCKSFLLPSGTGIRLLGSPPKEKV